MESPFLLTREKQRVVQIRRLGFFCGGLGASESARAITLPAACLSGLITAVATDFSGLLFLAPLGVSTRLALLDDRVFEGRRLSAILFSGIAMDLVVAIDLGMGVLAVVVTGFAALADLPETSVVLDDFPAVFSLA